jgi:cysteine desulfuration protein SufE
MLPPLDEIVENFELLDDWDDRYRYLIELGRMMEPLPEESRTERNRVQGCASQVWLVSAYDEVGGAPVLRWQGDSDAHIVRGLVALMLALHSGRTPREVLEADAQDVMRRIGLDGHLTPQRSNGLRSMVERIRADARAALTV